MNTSLRIALMGLCLSACTDPGYDVVRTSVPAGLPLAQVMIPAEGRPLIIVSDKLTGNCYIAAIEHERRHIADPNWQHGHEPFVCHQSIDSLTASFLNNANVPTPMPSRSKGGTNATLPGICDAPVNGGPRTAYCKRRNGL